MGTELGLKRWFLGREVGHARGFGDEKGVETKAEAMEIGFKVGDLREWQIEGVTGIIGGPHSSISEPISGGRV